MDRPSFKSPSDTASDSGSSATNLIIADSPDLISPFNSSPNPYKDVQNQSPASLRSEEYRQLFRIPPEEVLLEDFNCACQENILIQGHMYLFVHYICFYSNIFGYETKQIIPFHEVTSVRRAKTAGIFPNAIEISAGGKKYFFASFLSRDEAFKLINEGLSRQADGAKTIIEQESIPECSTQENGSVAVEKVRSLKSQINELESIDGNQDATLKESELPPSTEDRIVPETVLEQEEIVRQDAEPVPKTKSSSPGEVWTWKEGDDDAPKIPESYVKAAESKFPIKVEEFFNYFVSDGAVSFIESFHGRCGDKEFRCSPWYPHETFGHVREVSFQHPIKAYFGAKLGSCQESQKFRVYKNSHLVVETSQEISDVPYGDYFRVEGLWDIERDGDGLTEGCVLRVYVNVAFSKRTMWKGKIVQSTVEECREAYEIWTEMAHQLLKQKNLEKREGEESPASRMIENGEVQSEREAKTDESTERSKDHKMIPQSNSTSAKHVGSLFQGSTIYTASLAALLKDSVVKFWSSFKNQNNLPPLLVIAFAVILLMQLSILVLLARPQHVHVVSPMDYTSGIGSKLDERQSTEKMAWLEKQISYLKYEMMMVESQIEMMHHAYAMLKAQMKELENDSNKYS